MSELRHHVFVTPMTEFAGPQAPNGAPVLWSPMAHALIHGPTEAVVTDPPITTAQTTELADWIESFERRLSYIYITHAHGDHWFGSKILLDRFPGAVVLATPAVIAGMKAGTPQGVAPQSWEALFPGRIPDLRIEPHPVPEGGFLVDGHTLQAIEAGHSDTDHSSMLHVPAIDLVVTGDVVYNNVHQYLVESGNGGLEAWQQALDVTASLNPSVLVPSHQDVSRPSSVQNLDETRHYLRDAGQLLASGPTREQFFDQMMQMYPDRLNPTIIWLNALGLLSG